MKLTEVQQAEITSKITAILTANGCVDSPVPTTEGYDIEPVEFLPNQSMIFIYQKSKTQTGVIRKPFKSNTPSYAISSQAQDAINEVLAGYGYSKGEGPRGISAGFYYQISYYGGKIK